MPIHNPVYLNLKQQVEIGKCFIHSILTDSKHRISDRQL